LSIRLINDLSFSNSRVDLSARWVR